MTISTHNPRLRKILLPLLLLIGSISLLASDVPRKTALLLGLATADSFVSATERPAAAPFYANSIEATVTTDRDDYSPGDVVMITGAGFGSGDLVTLQVTDIGPAGISEMYDASGYGTWTVGADSTGAFSTSWLVGVEALNRRLRLTAVGSPSGATASTTFTDASVDTYDQCSNDEGEGYPTGDTGCRWVNGNLQANNSTYPEGDATVQRVWLTGFVPGSTHTITFQYGTTKQGKHAYDYLTKWDWSEDWITLTDRCQDITGCATAAEAVLAIPNDPNVPDTIENAGPGARQFVMRGGTMSHATDPAIDSGTYAGDSETLITVTFTVGGSGGPMCETNQGITTCGVAIWFGAHIAMSSQWEAYNGTTGAGSISGSPYHVALYRIDGESVGQRDNQMQANAVVPVLGTITIIKDAVPNDAQDFPFTSPGLTPTSFNLDDDGDPTLSNTQTFLNVPIGSYTVSEGAVAGWSLTNIVCVDPNGGTTTSIPGRSATIDVSAGEAITCTFTNTLNSASITVIKDAVPNDAQDFSFTTTGTGPAAFTGGFSLDDDADLTLSNTQTFTFTGAAATGSKTITEGSVTGWDLTGLVCSEGSTDTATRTATISLDPGDSVTCTFTNTKRGSITIVKDAVPNDAQDFSFTATESTDTTIPDFSLDDDADGTLSNTVTFNNLKPGNYSVTEDGETGWDLTNLVCGAGGTPSGSTASIVLPAGGSVTCTFTNTKDATVTIVKDAVPNDAQDFAFTTTGSGPAPWSGFSLDDDADPTLSNQRSFTFPAAQQGAKTVTEGTVSGWSLTTLNCSEGSTDVPTRTASFTVDPGDAITCTFTNSKDATLTIVKQANPEGSTSFDFDGTGTGVDADFDLVDDGAGPGDNDVTFTFQSGAFGIKTVTETDLAGWDLNSATCIGGTDTDTDLADISVDIQPGNDVTCTFTNTARGTVTLIKTEIGGLPTRAFTFEIREGASATEEGEILATGTAGIGQSDPVVFDCGSGVDAADCENIPGPTGVAHFPPGTYQLCETNLLPGWTHTLGSLGTVFVPNSDIPIPDNTIECVTITITAGTVFDAGTIDNRPPGDARTIGFWKNWTSCDGNGNQAPVLDYVLSSFPGAPVDPADTPEDETQIPGWPGPYVGVNLGSLLIDTCAKAVSILDKRTIGGGGKSGRGFKTASDPAFGMAAQLLAAKLNLQAGAGEPDCLAAIIAEADALLIQVGFDGINPPNYGSGPVATATKARANYLAGLLDDYNNNMLDCDDYEPLP